jgi:hypothetical protein
VEAIARPIRKRKARKLKTFPGLEKGGLPRGLARELVQAIKDTDGDIDGVPNELKIRIMKRVLTTDEAFRTVLEVADLTVQDAADEINARIISIGLRRRILDDLFDRALDLIRLKGGAKVIGEITT